MGSTRRGPVVPVLVGHPLTALERELKRLVVREELEREQSKIVQENAAPKDVKDKLLKLYDLYETFKNADNSCLSDTDTKYNLYQLYKEVFQSKRSLLRTESSVGGGIAGKTVAKWKNGKPRAATASPSRALGKQSTRAQMCTSATHSAPVTFPGQGGGREAPQPAAGIPTRLQQQSTGLSPKGKSSSYRPHSAPAEFQYNKLYTANRCYSSRRPCSPCRTHCACLHCSPLRAPPKPCWRDITCALTPDRSQIEAHWEEMSPLIQSQLHVPDQNHNIKKKVGKKSKTERKQNIDEDTKSAGRKKKSKRSRDEVKSIRGSRQEQKVGAKPQQAWAAARPVTKTTQPPANVTAPKKMKKSEGSNFPQKRVQRNRHHNRYQRNKKVDKRYRWDKVSSDSDSDDGADTDVLDVLDNLPEEEEVVYRGRILRERKRHKWGDYQALLTARALYLYNREYDHHPKEILPLWGTKLSINADKTDLQYSFILKTASTNKSKAMYKMSALTEEEMRTWLTKIREAMKANTDITAEITRNKKPSVFGELPEHPSWSHEGYRIDVSYINDNILVSSFPPTRSDVYELKRFMDDKHKGSYKIVNVCEKHYDAAMFGENIVSYPTPSNGICRLADLWSFCEYTEKWLKEDETNVVLVHCQTGTVRSGLFVASYLIHSRVCWTSEQAIKLFKTKRENGTISAPCHKRYLKYIETSVLAGEHPEDISLLFSCITLSNSPAFNEDGSCKPYFVVFQNGEEVYEFESTESYKTEEPISFPMSLQISGDIKIQFYSVSDILGTQDMFTIHFHTFYINSSNVRFSREMIDGAHLNTFKQFTDSFSVSLEVK